MAESTRKGRRHQKLPTDALSGQLVRRAQQRVTFAFPLCVRPHIQGKYIKSCPQVGSYRCCDTAQQISGAVGNPPLTALSPCAGLDRKTSQTATVTVEGVGNSLAFGSDLGKMGHVVRVPSLRDRLSEVRLKVYQVSSRKEA